MKLFSPEVLFIERAVIDHPVTRSVQARYPGIKTRTIDSARALGAPHLPANERITQEKRGLALAYKRGELVKEVQRDLYRPIPNEYYIIHSFGCPFDCQYCFLFDYLDHQVPTLFVNLDEIVQDVRETIERQPGERLAFHAGEFSDALAYDHITNLSSPLVELFAGYDHAVLELRTKSDNISNLLGLAHRGRTVVSWTFSPQKVVQLYEYHTATEEERIDAAARCQEAGYPVALRFDPVIRYPGWEEDYRSLVDKLARSLDPDLITDCHLGVFRFTRGLGNVIRERFPKSWLRLEESVPCTDSKFRYLRPLRTGMYRKMLEHLRSAFPAMKLELCMDSPEVEESVKDLLAFSTADIAGNIEAK